MQESLIWAALQSFFDTFNTPQAGRDLREAALQLLDQPIGYVVNSHWHGDHVRGNQCFGDVPIVSSGKTRGLILTTQPQWLERMTCCSRS